MKISWGTGIAAVYITFVAAVVATVLFSSTQEVNLVTENYYEEELAYQSRIDKIERTKRLPEQLRIYIKDELINFDFPKDIDPTSIGGRLTFYRPSDNKLDLSYPISLNSEGEQFISTSNFLKGLWRVQVDWTSKDQSYYNEQILVIN